MLERGPADAESGKAALLELVGEEEGRLEERLTALLERQDADAGAEPEFDASDAGERLRRYQATCDRSLLRVLDALRKRRREAEGSSARVRRPASPAREEAPDPLRGIAGLLNLVAAARVAAATNEANRPADGAVGRPIPDQGEPPVPEGRVADGDRETTASSSPEAASAPRHAGSERASQDSEACDQAATNEANEPRRAAGRPMSTMPVALLSLLALLLCVGLAAAFGASHDSHPFPAASSPDAGHAPAHLSHPDRTDEPIQDERDTPSRRHIHGFP